MRHRNTANYRWQRDYPLQLQASQPSGSSVIILEFALTVAETGEFKRLVGSDLNGTLPLRIALNSQEHASVTVHKKGPGAAVLTTKLALIARFVESHLRFEHIPAVRTAVSAQRVVQRLVEAQLEQIEESPDYLKALASVEALQRPILDELARNICTTLRVFIPDVQDVVLSIPRDVRAEALRTCQIQINDGTQTLLEFKGDGVQSLAALGIIQHVSDS